jgi:formylglycine-generating enzyme required for sulfatase activity
VAWGDAAKFVAWLGPALGATCRLPCESEWEYASRGGRYGVWAHGDDASELRSFAVYGTELPAPVGSRKPNGFGLFDMLGNAAELCEVADRWTDDPARPVPPDAGSHPVRGGRFNELLPGMTDPWPEQHRCARRHWEPADSLLSGFRVLRELPP